MVEEGIVRNEIDELVLRTIGRVFLAVIVVGFFVGMYEVLQFGLWVVEKLAGGAD